jgi:hypothetical protein
MTVGGGKEDEDEDGRVVWYVCGVLIPLTALCLLFNSFPLSSLHTRTQYRYTKTTVSLYHTHTDNTRTLTRIKHTQPVPSMDAR